MFDYFFFGEFFGDPHGAFYGFGFGAAVADYESAVDAEKRRAAIFGVVEFFLEAAQGRENEERGCFGQESGVFDGVFDELEDGAGQSFTEFEDDVADEAVADDYVNDASGYVAPFDVADEVECLGVLQQRVCREDLVVALCFFFTDVEEADAGFFDAEDVFGVYGAHDGALEEVLGFGVGVGA